MKRVFKLLGCLALVMVFSFMGIQMDLLVNRAEAAVDFIRPAEGTITSGFRTPDRPTHHGIDIAKSGTVSIKASAAGTVSRSYLSSSYGNVVFVKHTINGTAYETVYAHMRDRAVSAGQKVSQGQHLGYMGATGDATGQHLHFEIHKPEWTSSKQYAVDPMKYIGKDSGGTSASFSMGSVNLKQQVTAGAGSTVSVKLSSLSQSPYSVKIRLTNVDTGNYTEETVPGQDGVFTGMRGGTYRVTLYQMNKGNISGAVTVKTDKGTYSDNFSISSSHTLSQQVTAPAGSTISVKLSSISQSPYNIRIRLTNVATGNYTEETVPSQDGVFTGMRGGTYKVTLYQLNSGPVSGKVTVSNY